MNQDQIEECNECEVDAGEKLTANERLAQHQENLLKNKKEKFLSISEMAKEQIDDLIENNPAYAKWMRVVLLRTLLNTSALNNLKSSYTFTSTKLFGYLGFKNFEEYSKKRDLVQIRADLLSILAVWQTELDDVCTFPSQLQRNLNALAEMASLSPLDVRVLGLTVLIHSESILQECTELIGENVSAFSIAKIYGPMLGLKSAQVEVVLDEQSNLIRSGLLSLDHRGEGNVRSRVDLITFTFAKRAVMYQHNVRDLVKTYIRPVPDGQLLMEDFVHIEDHAKVVKDYLQDAISTGKSGVNILIYGRPGTGKTEFSKLVSKELGCELLEVVATTLAGNPVTPMRRIRSYRVAQSLFMKGKSLILFDECEEVLTGRSRPLADDEATMAQKSWINLTLENNALPAIWVANSISCFDPAYIRRFDLCFEMPIPDEIQRRNMLMQMCGETLDQQLIADIAKNSYTSPGLVVKTAQVVKALAFDKSPSERNELALMLVNDKLQAQGVTQVQSYDAGSLGLGFKPDMINSTVDLQHLLQGVAQTREARICAWGPPGTGKTAFGKWMANQLSIPHVVLKASDLLGSHVGETEQKIAGAFAAAKRQKALLQFDEVDTFLVSRAQAKQSWEVSMVNEMLTQMEAFKGIFIASTNLFENLDEAALRRFDINLKFDFMKMEKAWELFLEICQKLKLPINEIDLQDRFHELRNLTPGDFEQLGRQSRFLNLESADDALQILSKAVAVKKVGSSRHIGFLAST
jgi:transitional endoplasmic reticulum ATPase